MADEAMPMPLVRLIDLFEERAARCADGTDLRALLDEVARELGFQHFALLHHASIVSARPGLVRIDNYPEGWEDELLTRGLAAHDPVHLACARTNIGFAWAELGAIVPLGALEREVLDRSGRYGLGEGFTIPVNIPGEPAGSCSFAVRRGRSLPARRLLCAETIGAHAFRAARRIHGFAASGGRPHLSRRERECLRLIARGKTDWEISAILGIRPETCRQYVKRARAAYDVASRTQLVVNGLRDSWIGYDDAIPP